MYEPLKHCDFVEPQGSSWRPPHQTQNNPEHFKIELVKVNPQRDRNIFVPTVCSLSKQNPSQIIHQRFGHVSTDRIKRMAMKGLMESLQTNIPEF